MKELLYQRQEEYDLQINLPLTLVLAVAFSAIINLTTDFGGPNS